MTHTSNLLENINIVRFGSEIAKLVDKYKPAGSYEVEFNPESSIKNLASGIYFYRLKAGDPSTGSGQSFIQTKKMIYLK